MAALESSTAPLFVSVDDHLRREADGPIRHEYIGGRIHAMAGGSERHNLIASGGVYEGVI